MLTVSAPREEKKTAETKGIRGGTGAESLSVEEGGREEKVIGARYNMICA